MQCRAPTPPSRPSSTTGAVAEDSGEVEEEAEEAMVEVKVEEEEEVTVEKAEVQVRVRARGSTPGTRRPDTLTSLHLSPVSGTGLMANLHTFVWSQGLVLGGTFGHRNLQLKHED